MVLLIGHLEWSNWPQHGDGWRDYNGDRREWLRQSGNIEEGGGHAGESEGEWREIKSKRLGIMGCTDLHWVVCFRKYEKNTVLQYYYYEIASSLQFKYINFVSAQWRGCIIYEDTQHMIIACSVFTQYTYNYPDWKMLSARCISHTLLAIAIIMWINLIAYSEQDNSTFPCANASVKAIMCFSYGPHRWFCMTL